MSGPKHVEVAHRVKSHLLALLGAYHILHVSRVRVKQKQSFLRSKLCLVFTPILKHNGYVLFDDILTDVTFIVGTIKTVRLRWDVRVDRWERRNE
jgi:hypothetical protein